MIIWARDAGEAESVRMRVGLQRMTTERGGLVQMNVLQTSKDE